MAVLVGMLCIFTNDCKQIENQTFILQHIYPFNHIVQIAYAGK